ncbi:MAG: TrmB family transcriptional regulator [Candidatus Bathyarchaeia archaeon]
MIESNEQLVELLNEELGLTPYESKAYIALLLHGPLSPRGVNQKSGIPRPRTYDVLNSLVGKGLLMEQPGRPRMYAAVDPRVGLEKIMTELERKMLRQLEEKRKIAERLSSSLSKLHHKSREMGPEEERVWVTRRDSAFIAKYCEAIRNIENEFVVATTAIRPPEKEVLEAVKHVLKKNKSVRVVRQISPHWTHDELEEYEELIDLGDQVRCLRYEGLRFAIADRRETVLVLPPKRGSQLAVWISLPSLADILYEHFEALWKKGQPALPILRKMKEAKAKAVIR